MRMPFLICLMWSLLLLQLPIAIFSRLIIFASRCPYLTCCCLLSCFAHCVSPPIPFPKVLYAFEQLPLMSMVGRHEFPVPLTTRMVLLFVAMPIIMLMLLLVLFPQPGLSGVAKPHWPQLIAPIRFSVLQLRQF